jgi:hypothetical protein
LLMWFCNLLSMWPWINPFSLLREFFGMGKDLLWYDK